MIPLKAKLVWFWFFHPDFRFGHNKIGLHPIPPSSSSAKKRASVCGKLFPKTTFDPFPLNNSTPKIRFTGKQQPNPFCLAAAQLPDCLKFIILCCFPTKLIHPFSGFRGPLFRAFFPRFDPSPEGIKQNHITNTLFLGKGSEAKPILRNGKSFHSSLPKTPQPTRNLIILAPNFHPLSPLFLCVCVEGLREKLLGKTVE